MTRCRMCGDSASLCVCGEFSCERKICSDCVRNTTHKERAEAARRGLPGYISTGAAVRRSVYSGEKPLVTKVLSWQDDSVIRIVEE